MYYFQKGTMVRNKISSVFVYPIAVIVVYYCIRPEKKSKYISNTQKSQSTPQRIHRILPFSIPSIFVLCHVHVRVYKHFFFFLFMSFVHLFKIKRSVFSPGFGAVRRFAGVSPKRVSVPVRSSSRSRIRGIACAIRAQRLLPFSVLIRRKRIPRAPATPATTHPSKRLTSTHEFPCRAVSSPGRRNSRHVATL